MYSTPSLSLNPPPYPVRSSRSPNFGALHMLQVCRLAQFTFPHLLHCQSSALKRPWDFSAAALPISIPSCLFFSALAAAAAPDPLRSFPHLLHVFLLAKFTFAHFGSAHTQSPSDALYLADISPLTESTRGKLSPGSEIDGKFVESPRPEVAVGDDGGAR